MASELKLSGSAGGRIIVQGNDTITTDQTFTFPDTGGELATAPAGGSAVGYQQGVWTPTVNAGTITSSLNSWERIGNQVTVRARIKSFTTLSASGIFVQGKPYLTAANTAALGSAMVTQFNNAATASYAEGTNIEFFQCSTGGNNPWRPQQYADRWNDANSAIWFQVTYLTDDTTWTPINGATVS